MLIFWKQINNDYILINVFFCYYLNRGWLGNMTWSGKQSEADADVPGVDWYVGQVLSRHPFLK